ncbi:hypothetical protein SSPO_024960 [Streptomyces antimycoticus]|uniref:Uncharacterized protein n=1 Tax=Streptomyces antimycoticus TaxID=68175 RepID=A0A499UJH1_9ACTN|nr:hypothetical protein SSPO_024960 [Streptomyces antimycoticus]
MLDDPGGDDPPVGADHALLGPALGEQLAQGVQIAFAHHRPEPGAVGRVGQRQIDVPDPAERDVRALQLDVGGVAEVEDGVQAEPVEEGRVRLGGMGEMAAAEQYAGPHTAAVGSRQSAEITEVAYPHQLSFGLGDLRRLRLLRHGLSFTIGRRRGSSTRRAEPTIRHACSGQSVSCRCEGIAAPARPPRSC